MRAADRFLAERRIRGGCGSAAPPCPAASWTRSSWTRNWRRRRNPRPSAPWPWTSRRTWRRGRSWPCPSRARESGRSSSWTRRRVSSPRTWRAPIRRPGTLPLRGVGRDRPPLPGPALLPGGGPPAGFGGTDPGPGPGPYHRLERGGLRPGPAFPPPPGPRRALPDRPHRGERGHPGTRRGAPLRGLHTGPPGRGRPQAGPGRRPLRGPDPGRGGPGGPGHGQVRGEPGPGQDRGALPPAPGGPRGLSALLPGGFGACAGHPGQDRPPGPDPQAGPADRGGHRPGLDQHPRLRAHLPGRAHGPGLRGGSQGRGSQGFGSRGGTILSPGRGCSGMSWCSTSGASIPRS
ncbi:MAG: hypothetical protein MZV64_09270 [Ignavibacteriales bacterium]|nr:hypothetical protein [Ignavibacteriales bacterium]